jgi:predicted dehydrogenase
MVRIGIAGIGFMGVTHFKALAQVRGARVGAICTRSEKKLAGDWRDVQGNFGDSGGEQNLEAITAYARYDELIRDQSIDLIDICLPSPMHADTTVAALEAGKHVLVEKPIALTVADADRMIAAAKSAGRQLMVAHVLRFAPPWAFVKEAMTSGRFGLLVTLSIRRVICPPKWSSSIADFAANGGPLIDLHIHDVDFVLHLLGKPRRVVATGRVSDGVVTYVAANYDYGGGSGGGPVVHCHGGAVAMAGRPFTDGYEACFEKATVAFATATEPADNDPAKRRSQAHELIVYDADGGVSFPQFDGQDPFVGQLAHAVQCVADDQPSTILGADSARQSLAMTFLERESILCGQYVDVT